MSSSEQVRRLMAIASRTRHRHSRSSDRSSERVRRSKAIATTSGTVGRPGKALRCPNECAAPRRLRRCWNDVVIEVAGIVRNGAPVEGDCDSATKTLERSGNLRFCPNERAARRRLRPECAHVHDVSGEGGVRGLAPHERGWTALQTEVSVTACAGLPGPME